MRDTLMRENFKSDNSRKIDKDGACVHELEASVSDLLSSSSGVQTRQLCTKQTPPKNVKETRKNRQPKQRDAKRSGKVDGKTIIKSTDAQHQRLAQNSFNNFRLLSWLLLFCLLWKNVNEKHSNNKPRKRKESRRR